MIESFINARFGFLVRREIVYAVPFQQSLNTFIGLQHQRLIVIECPHDVVDLFF